jgi:hypothetical protein
MQALKFNTTIDSRRRLELDLPPDTPEGTAEVIILVPEPSIGMANDSLRALFERLDAQPLQRSYTREEVDAFLAEERAGWGEP